MASVMFVAITYSFIYVIYDILIEGFFQYSLLLFLVWMYSFSLLCVALFIGTLFFDFIFVCTVWTSNTVWYTLRFQIVQFCTINCILKFILEIKWSDLYWRKKICSNHSTVVVLNLHQYLSDWSDLYWFLKSWLADQK